MPLSCKTLVIVGLGHTGNAIAAWGQGFSITVLRTRAHPVPVEHIDEVHSVQNLNSLRQAAVP